MNHPEYFANITPFIDPVSFAHTMANEHTASSYLHDIFNNIIIHSRGTHYIYNTHTGIWDSPYKTSFVIMITSYISHTLRDLESNCNDPVIKTLLLKTKKKFKNITHTTKICTLLKSKYMAVDSYDKLDAARNVINFKDVLYELDTGIVRKRTKLDYVTKTLEFKYDDNPNIEIYNQIKKIVFEILNDDVELFEFVLSWFGYAMTGETTAKNMLYLSHDTKYSRIGGNGKTTLLLMFECSLPIYYLETSRPLFNKLNAKHHDYVVQHVHKPVRLYTVPEECKYAIDVDRLNQFIDGDDIMHNDNHWAVHAKFCTGSNLDNEYYINDAIGNRGVNVNLENYFVEQGQYDAAVDKSRFHVVDKWIMGLFRDNDTWKMEFIRLLLPYAKKFYQTGIQIPKKLNDDFRHGIH